MKTTKTNEEILSEAMTINMGKSDWMFDFNDESIDIVRAFILGNAHRYDVALKHLNLLQAFSNMIKNMKNNKEQTDA